MDDNFWKHFDETPFEVPVPRRTIRPASDHPAAPRAPAQGAPLSIRWGVNDLLNCRLPLALGWKPETGARAQLQFKAALPGGPPIMLLASSDRLVAVAGNWTLLDMAGHALASGVSHSCVPSLDGAGTRLIAGNEDGTLAVRRLSDGSLEVNAAPLATLDHDRTFVSLRGARMVLASRLLQIDVHAPPAQQSMIETIDLNYEGKGPASLEDLVRQTAIVFPAITGDRIVLAMRDRIYFLDFDLKFQDAWAGDFQPLGVSLDEAGAVYLLAGRGTSVSLWKLAPPAERAWEIPLPPELVRPIQPPIVGYDHTVYLVAAQQIMAVSPAGRVLWRKPAASVSGAFVTPDDRLVVAEGSQLVAWTPAGERQPIFDCGEALVTPPIMTADGRIYAASRANLFCIRLPR